MPSTIVIGGNAQFESYLKDYINSNNIRSFEIEVFEEEILIASAREIKRKLSFSVSGSKAFVFKCDLTIESQNALLKTLEESGENIHFIFKCKNEESLLPTIASRSIVRRFGSQVVEVSQLVNKIQSICSEDFPAYSDIDSLLDLAENDLQILTIALREVLIDQANGDYMRSKSYNYCKRLLPLISLSKNNNVSKNIVLEKAFMLSQG